MTPTEHAIVAAMAVSEANRGASAVVRWAQSPTLPRALRLAAIALVVGWLGRLLVQGLLFVEQLARLVVANLGG